ncbi:MAG: nucleotide sugar dehydrogenase [Acidimicrobiales bacterium]|jgi:UDP-N-acetyl-D-glucosamine dehydrogenase
MGQRVAVLGQGYVGLPLAVRATEVGYEVTGFDVDKERIEQLCDGESYIEDISTERLRAALATGRYVPTSDIAGCADFDVAVIAVPTPLRDGVPDVSYIEQACELLGPFVRPDCCVVLESTTYPGTTTEVVAPILEQASRLVAGGDFRLGYSPERIDPGNGTWQLENTPKLVAGVDGASLAAVKGFYDTVVGETVEMKGTAEAELAKLLENTFRHVNIALVNELAMTCGDLGVDIWEAIRGASTKPFGFLPFFPGPGVGGHCIPVDPSFLSWRVRRRMGQAFRFVEIANDVNEHMPNYVVRRLTLGLNRRSLAVNGSTVLVLGLAYKSNSSDIRESPAVPVVEQLLELGARVRLADPLAGPSPLDGQVTRVEATVAEAAGADGVVLLTDHDAFDLASLAAAARYFLDTRHRVSGDAVEYL